MFSSQLLWTLVVSDLHVVVVLVTTTLSSMASDGGWWGWVDSLIVKTISFVSFL